MGVSETFNNIKVLVLKEASSSVNFSHETLQPASQCIKINILHALLWYLSMWSGMQSLEADWGV